MLNNGNEIMAKRMRTPSTERHPYRNDLLCLMWKRKTKPRPEPQRTRHSDAPICCWTFKTYLKSINPALCSHNSLQFSWKAFHEILEHGCWDLWPFRASARYCTTLTMGKRWLAVSSNWFCSLSDPVYMKNNKSSVYSMSIYIVLTDWLIAPTFNARSDGTTRGRSWTLI